MSDHPYSIVVHGGAGPNIPTTINRGEYVKSLSAAVTIGYDLLTNGTSAVDATQRVVEYLESHPLYNAGVGSVYELDGQHSLEAAIMDGHTRKCGAVTLLRSVEHPIALARLVMDKTPHCYIGGDGAVLLAKQYGVRLVDNSYFSTAERWSMLQKQRAAMGLPPLNNTVTITQHDIMVRDGFISPSAAKSSASSTDTATVQFDSKGTVGAVALDKHGHLAAATSTGGMTAKLPGRIGDTPGIGNGTYAADGFAAVSGTGAGEYFIRSAVARDVISCLQWSHDDGEANRLGRACERVMEQSFTSLGPEALGGLIAIDPTGDIAMPFNTSAMFRGWCQSKDHIKHVAIFEHEEQLS